MKKTGRRKFFVDLGRGVVGASILPTILPGLRLEASAQQRGNDHYFVYFRVRESLDVLLGLDPMELHGKYTDRPKEIFTGYRNDEIIRPNDGIALAPPAASLAPYANRMVVINGVNMKGNIIHEVCNEYISSGKTDFQTAHISAQLAKHNGAGPKGIVVDDRGIVLGDPEIAPNPCQYKELLNEGDQNEYADIFRSLGKNDRHQLGRASKGYFDSDEAAGFQDWFNRIVKDKENLKPEEAFASAFLGGLARQAQMSVIGSLDTHFNHEARHPVEQKKVWDRFAKVLEVFDGIELDRGTLLDRTTFMVATEFSRTPGLVDGGNTGKDENPGTNSVLLVGKGIKQGGVTVGKSVFLPTSKERTSSGSSVHRGMYLDFKSGETSVYQDATRQSQIHPEHVLRTVAAIMGAEKLDSHIDMELPIIPGVLG